MREIKFRAWNKTARGMIEWYFIKSAPLEELTNQPHLELMQYTGLKDKNGVEIYEGDIVRVGFMPGSEWDEEKQDEVDTYEETWVAKVEWDTPGTSYSLVAPVGHDFFGEFGSTTFGWALESGEYDAEVIGNIYENKELIKGN